LANDNDEPVIAAHPFSMQWDKRRGRYWHLHIDAPGFRIQLSVSPTGRKCRLFVNGDEVTS
jgi:hypothetical protein